MPDHPTEDSSLKDEDFPKEEIERLVQATEDPIFSAEEVKDDTPPSTSDIMQETLNRMGKEKAEAFKGGGEAIIDNIFKKGMMPQDALNISPQQTENMYAQAYQYYNTGKYKEARTMFSGLMFMNAYEPKYMFGHAACSHMLEDYELAAKTYMQVGSIDSLNPVPYYHAADCYIKLEDNLSAIIALKLAVKRSGGKPEYDLIKDRSIMTIKQLEEKGIEVKEENRGEKREGA